jgi:hypothetical protein
MKSGSRLLLSLGLVAFMLPTGASAGDGAGDALLMEQLTQFNGGCPPNECANVQFSVHRAPACTNGPNENLGAYSTSMVRRAGSSELAGGSSTLVRAGDGLAFNLTSTGMLPDAPYTVWWVAFNPENSCVDECTCTGDDLGADATVFYAGGAMSDSLGNATFAANIRYGEVPEGEDQVIVEDDEGDGGIVDGAEIHIVVRGHGDALKGNGGNGKGKGNK